jgi:hypothetical protein
MSRLALLWSLNYNSLKVHLRLDKGQSSFDVFEGIARFYHFWVKV